jgi:hypothetical protein
LTKKHRTSRTTWAFAPPLDWRVLSLLLVGLLAWRILSHAAADLLAADEPQAALFWEDANPTALTILTQKELEKSDEAHSRAATKYAARLISRDPLAPGALSLYGMATARMGEVERAEKILHVAAAHLPIDLIAHGWLYERALKKADLSTALTELDVLLRGRPFITPQIGPSVAALIGTDAEGEAGFVRLLSTSPPWRPSLLAYLSSNLKDADSLVRLFGRLQTSAAPATAEEMRPYLDRLVRDGKLEQAYLAWLSQLPPDRLSHLGLLYNNRFQHPVSNLPFDWQIIPVSGASVEVVAEGKESVLNVEFYGARVSFAHVTHLLMLPPGKYAFSGSGQTENLDNERGLRWRIYCTSDSAGALATTDFLKKTTPPHSFRVTFSVPPTACTTQMLVLEIPARIAIETEVSGSARFSNLSIDNLDSVAK